MPEIINISDKIEKNLPSELLILIKEAVAVAADKKLRLFLVGGIVRDLQLGQNNFDLDLVVEGDAIGLAKEFVQKAGGKLTLHPMFNTAKITLGKWGIDFAMARTETYDKPGALPVVTPGSLKTDLLRRDFTINAMAVSLNPDNYGELIDLYHGLDDLKNKIIRVLHEKSFIDDATRIWRTIRYGQRLGFRIEPDTLRFLNRDVQYLRTVGGYRLRHELELVLEEQEPEKVLVRAEDMGALKELNPALKGDDWLLSKFKEARFSGRATPNYYLGLLTYRLTAEELAQLSKYLRFSPEQVKTINDVRASVI